MSGNLLYQSFAGGEITPELYGRLDLGKYQTGLALVRNWLVLPHGPVQNRSGFAFVNEAKDVGHNVRVIPFSFSAEETMVLEFGHEYIRFHTNGATLLETAKPVVSIATGITTQQQVTAHGFSTGDWVYTIAGALSGFRFYRIVVVDADNYELRTIAGAQVDTTGWPLYAGGATAARVYTLASTYQGVDLLDLHFVQSADVLTITHPSYPIRELRRLGATNWTLVTVSFAPTLAAPAAPTVAITGPGGGTAVVHDYVITAIAADGLEESLASASSASAAIDLSVAGNEATIAPSVALPAVVARFNVYKKLSGLFGYIGQSSVAGTFHDNNITPDMTKTPPEASITLNTLPGLYPSAVTYHEQRRAFGATNADPAGLWMTRPGTESNLTTSIPSQDDDAISLRIKAREQNRIRHLVSLGDLLALTASGEWRIFSGDQPVITPTTISAKQQGGTGASNVQPALTSGSVLYVQSRGSHVRELTFSNDKNGYVTTDMSIMAPHLFDTVIVYDIAYARAPMQTLWVVTSDGRLLGMTYVPEHQVFAWHQHTTDGSFESVAVVAEGNEDALYVAVARNVNGRIVRNIERMASRLFNAKEDAFIVDSGLTYRGAPTSTISNLYHLEGKLVSILADGAVETPQTVVNGRITISAPASVIHVGLPIVADLMTLPIALMNTPASGQGRTKNINAAMLRIHRTTGLSCGPSFNRLTPVPGRSDEAYGTAPALRTGVHRITLSPSWVEDGQVCLRQTDPVPATILSMALDAAVGG
jgi:hypothetical protein